MFHGVQVYDFSFGITKDSIVAMTHACPWFFSAKVRRDSSQNEQLWQTLDIGDVFRPTYGLTYLQYFQFEE